MAKKKEQVRKKPVQDSWVGIEVQPVPMDYDVLSRYSIREGYAEVVIASPPGRVVEPKYYCVEVPLEPKEKEVVEKVKDILTKELDFPKYGELEEVRRAVLEAAGKVLKKYGKGLGIGEGSPELMGKFQYYVERDMMGFGPLDIVFEDHRIEDISCNGVNVPVYVYHRDFESIPTNIVFTERSALDNYIIHLVHKANKHISSAFPIVDAMIYGKHRLAATFREEVSPRGSTFTVRKFRERPFTIIELLQSNVISSQLAAYMWLMLENKASVMILGATGSGKTTVLNAFTTFIKPLYKIVTCEETPEINIPRDNWVRFVTRESYGLGSSDRGRITLYDLVRTSLRYRPDYLIVGEVRGEEAYVLFQAMATGHGGLSTMHAESLDTAVKRLTSPPMNIAPSFIPLMNCVIYVERVIVKYLEQFNVPARRVRYVWEVVDFDNYQMIGEWDHRTDGFRTYLRESALLKRLSTRLAKTVDELLTEIEKRRLILDWMVKKNISKPEDVNRVVLQFYERPDSVLATASAELNLLVQREYEESGPRMLINVIQRMGGKSDLKTLLQTTKMKDTAFWDSLNLLIRKGEVELLEGGIVKLKLKIT
ncbi:MAG: type II/IV secretion system ATPase subunit [Thaumarchaeota archaeon]|nr:type II/IV secretion system ATPase subunit [Candidatus Calditenuaceae archaeon]MDW8042287.1 type II/IV secretion system ATPase subunit [Nitrososphaerota archaeon]